MANSITILAAGTFIRGDLYSDDILIVEGGIEGNVVGNKVVVKSNGWVHGDLACKSLLIEMGGLLNGYVRVSTDPPQQYLAWAEAGILPEPESDTDTELN